MFTKRGSFSIYLFTDFEDYLPMPLDWIYPYWILMAATTHIAYKSRVQDVHVAHVKSNKMLSLFISLQIDQCRKNKCAIIQFYCMESGWETRCAVRYFYSTTVIDRSRRSSSV